MTTIAIANQKGGCGKTTTAINLAACLGRKEQRVLLIDMDPQGHASLGLGENCEDIAGLYEVFLQDVSLQEAILPEVVKGVDLVPATISLAAAEHLLADIPKRERQLEMHLASLPKNYDFIILDCPPSLGLLSINALRVANRVLIPLEMSRFALDGIDRLCETINLVEEKYDLEIPVHILPTLVDYRTRFTQMILDEVTQKYPDQITAASIHYTIRLKEAVNRGIPIIDHAPGSAASYDYHLLADEIIHGHEAAWQEKMIEVLNHSTPAASKPGSDATSGKTINTITAPPLNKGEMQRVVLSFPYNNGADLKIAGDFNNWVPDQAVETITSNGLLHKILNVPAGAYQYRLIMDGEWREDPNNPHHVTNLYGETNSLLKVEAKREMASA